jgi:toxin YoeB
MYFVKFDTKVETTISKWKKSNPNQYKKLVKVILSIAEDPRHGIGHPEPLVGGDGITYSRRITANDRIIYRIFDDEVYVIVIELSGHYNDK